MAEYEDKLERMQADGRITTGDADEVRNFAWFLEATAGIPLDYRDRTPEQQRAFFDAYARHYPEDFERDHPEEYAKARARIEAAGG